MLIYAIDDESNMLYLLHQAIAEAAPEAEILDFSLGSQAVAFLEGGGARPDAVFSDIRMPGLSGLELAVRLKTLAPRTKLVFVTGYDYAVDAYQLHVHGYITKPVEAERVREELDVLFPQPPAGNRLQVRCFGSFEVFWQGRPLHFGRGQTRELLAYLVDRRGALCSAEEIIGVLWEDAADTANAKHRLRNLVSDLKAALDDIGQGGVLIRQRNRLAVKTDLLDCDYYRMLTGDMGAVNAFSGEYMEQYTWAEITKGGLVFRKDAGEKRP